MLNEVQALAPVLILQVELRCTMGKVPGSLLPHVFGMGGRISSNSTMKARTMPYLRFLAFFRARFVSSGVSAEKAKAFV